MALFQHELFTIDLNKVVAIWYDEEQAAVTIRTDDQRKIEVATETLEEGLEFLNGFAGQWENAVGPLLRHANYIFLTAAIYSIQAGEGEVFIYFQDHSVSFAVADAFQGLELLSKLTEAWQIAIANQAARKGSRKGYAG